jgi:peptidyl-prolyl cis-trans isomerase A (cyclophilin A)
VSDEPPQLLHGVDVDGGVAGEPGYAVFGLVVDGMDVVRAITQQPRAATAQVAAMKGQMLAVPVKILTARRVNQP